MGRPDPSDEGYLTRLIETEEQLARRLDWAAAEAAEILARARLEVDAAERGLESEIRALDAERRAAVLAGRDRALDDIRARLTAELAVLQELDEARVAGLAAAAVDLLLAEPGAGP